MDQIARDECGSLVENLLYLTLYRFNIQSSKNIFYLTVQTHPNQLTETSTYSSLSIFLNKYYDYVTDKLSKPNR